ncbi:MAG: 16S rRNA (uracil(1498)-N(3))-methyltransferase [Granulosicoccaceae bacterium]
MNREARTPRFYQAGPLTLDDEITLEKRISHHLISVLRAHDAEQIILFNGDGFEYLCTLNVQAKRATATVIGQHNNHAESPLHITLVQAISRGSNMDTSIQKAVELGVNVIQPVYTRHSVPLLQGNRGEKKATHWQSVIISAAEQSGRCTLPQLDAAVDLGSYLSQLEHSADELRWVLSPASEQQAFNAGTWSRAIVIVGPESGFDADEVIRMTQAGFEERLLGSRILRTETAGPAVVAVLQTLYGDFK